MEIELNNIRLKYENNVLWRWKYKNGRGYMKTPFWSEIKQTPDKKNGYSRITLQDRRYLYHRVVYKVNNPEWNIDDVSSDNQTDHISAAKPANNRIENLRILNNQQNQWNNLHYAKGYTWNKKNRKYEASIKTNGKRKYLGLFKTTEEAHECYLKAKAEHHIIT